eukprot:6481499-Amphidinium_carterae.1
MATTAQFEESAGKRRSGVWQLFWLQLYAKNKKQTKKRLQLYANKGSHLLRDTTERKPHVELGKPDLRPREKRKLNEDAELSPAKL